VSEPENVLLPVKGWVPANIPETGLLGDLALLLWSHCQDTILDEVGQRREP
jgi:hypothetical protein